MADRRPFLAAVVDPEVAFYWAAELGPAIERLASRRSARLRRKMLQSREQLREAGRQWAEGRISECEPAEVVEQVGTTLTVGEVATALGVTPEWVRRLCHRGELEARQMGRVWVIEEWSVRTYQAARDQSETA